MKWRSLEESAVAADNRPLRDQLAERKQLIEKYVPETVREVHRRVVEELCSRGMLNNVVAAGSPAPQFELQDQLGRTVSSRELLASGPAIICFFRGRWCPFCVTQLEAMNVVAPEISRTGASLVAISPQTVHQNQLMADQHKISFPLLSDANNHVAREFGLVYRVPEEQEAVYRRSFVNLPFINGDESWQLPIAAAFVLTMEGKILFSSANPDYTERTEPGELLQALHTQS
jgi:peroxiredoxin